MIQINLKHNNHRSNAVYLHILCKVGTVLAICEGLEEVSDQVKHKYILAKIGLIAAVASIFNIFLVLLQKDELLIHILHSQ